MSSSDSIPLAPRDLLILVVLAEGDNHGYGLIKEAEHRSPGGVFLDPANLYRTLRRMRESGWIRESPGSGEDRRRVYSITREGREILAAEVRRLDDLLASARPALAK